MNRNGGAILDDLLGFPFGFRYSFDGDEPDKTCRRSDIKRFFAELTKAKNFPNGS
jgi:hypothetical protein